MSEEKSSQVPVKVAAGSLADLLGSGGGEDVTSQQITNNMSVSDENLALKTEVHDPMMLAAWDAVACHAEALCYVRTAAFMRNISKFYRENMVSFKRQGRKEVKEMVIADLQRSREDGENEWDKLTKRGGGR